MNKIVKIELGKVVKDNYSSCTGGHSYAGFVDLMSLSISLSGRRQCILYTLTNSSVSE